MDCCFAMEALEILFRRPDGPDCSVFASEIRMMSGERPEVSFPEDDLNGWQDSGPGCRHEMHPEGRVRLWHR